MKHVTAFTKTIIHQAGRKEYLNYIYKNNNFQELLGHKDVKTTMIYTHVLNRGGLAVRSPLDDIERL